MRKLKGLEDIIPFTSVHWHMADDGWRFSTPDEQLPGENVTPDPLHPDFTHLRDLYFAADPSYIGRFTVPTLWDKQSSTIVSNESSEIIRMLYTEFDALLPEGSAARELDLFPAALREEIEAVNDWTYNEINNGVYKAGFATTAEAYEKNVTTLFAALDRAESHLQKNLATPSHGPFYFPGATPSEADIRLFTTIVRFDAVYVQHFKCNIRDVRSGYPALHRWLRHLYWNVPAFGPATTQFEHIKRHYTRSHPQINKFAITPLGPLPDILPEDGEVAAVGFALRKGA